MRRVPMIVVCFTFLLISASGRAAAEDASSFAGTYACAGIGPDGQPYKALLQVVAFGDRVRARWTFPDGPPVLGLGLLRHGVLAISYFSPGTVGLVIYRVEHDKLSLGEWVTAGGQGVYRESLRKLPDNYVPVEPTPHRDRPGTSSRLRLAHGAIGDARMQPARAAGGRL